MNSKLVLFGVFVSSLILTSSPSFATNSCLSNSTLANPNISTSTINDLSNICDRIDQIQGNQSAILSAASTLLVSNQNLTQTIANINENISSGAIQTQVQNLTLSYLAGLPTLQSFADSLHQLYLVQNSTTDITSFKQEIRNNFESSLDFDIKYQNITNQLATLQAQVNQDSALKNNGGIATDSTTILIIVGIIGAAALGIYLFSRKDKVFSARIKKFGQQVENKIENAEEQIGAQTRAHLELSQEEQMAIVEARLKHKANLEKKANKAISKYKKNKGS